MATPLPLPELDEEEQLFYSVVHCPVQECESLLKGVASADIRNGSGRTLLHVAVRLGKSEWVHKLLSMGSDPCAMDRRGDTVLAVAEEMCTKYPSEGERWDISAIVRLAHERDLSSGQAKTETSATLSSGTLEQGNGLTMQQMSTTLTTLSKEILSLKESVKGELQGIASQMVSISQSLQEGMPQRQSGDSVARVTPLLPSNLPSPGREHHSEPNDQFGVTSQAPFSTTLPNENSGDVTNLISSCATEDSCRTQVGSDALQNLVADMGAVESQNVVVLSSTSSTVIAGGEPQNDPPSTGMENCMQVQRDSVDGIMSGKQISELKAIIDEMRKMFVSRDFLLRALETSVTSMAEEFVYVKGHIEEIGEKVSTVNEGLGILRDSLSRNMESIYPLMEMRQSEACVEAMMRITDILNGDEGKMYEIRGYYAHLCSINLLAPLLSFIATQAQVRVVIDCRSQYIGALRERFVDHDGIIREGGWFYSFADFEKRRVYVGGKTSVSRKREAVMGWLARSLTQMAMHLAFNNGGRPYTEDNVEARDRYRRIVNRAEETEDRCRALDTYLRWSLDWDAFVMKEVKLMSAVPLMIAEYGYTEARMRLQQQLPELLDYYVDHVLGTLKRETEAAHSVSCSISS